MIATAPATSMRPWSPWKQLGASLVLVVPSVIATTRCSTSLYTWSPCGLGAFVVQIVPSIVPFVFATAHAAQIYTWSPRGLGAVVVPIMPFVVTIAHHGQCLWSPRRPVGG